MPRPKLAIPYVNVVEAYHKTGSIRGAARELGVSRWAVKQRLEEFGITPRDRLDAMAAVKVVEPDPVHYRETIRVEHLGDTTTVTTRTLTAYVPCVWPCCDEDRAHGRLCEEHSALCAETTSRCQWPNCTETPLGDPALCYYHRGLADGRVTH